MSYGRKTRSDKGGHHHHSAGYEMKKALSGDDNKAIVDSSASSNDATGELKLGAVRKGITDNEVLVLCLLAVLSSGFLILSRFLSKRDKLKITEINQVNHQSWLIRMEEMELSSRLSKSQSVSEWKSMILDHLNTLLSEKSITQFEYNGVLTELEGVNSSAAKDAYSKIIVNANNRIKWREMFEEDSVERMINGEYWSGMSEQQLILMRGEPTKIETELLKTKVNKFYIYGTKSTGDVFVFNEGKLERFKDR